MGAPDKTRIKRLLGLVSEKCAAIVCPNEDYEAAVWEVFTGGFAPVPVAMDRVTAMADANLAIYADLSAFDEPDMHKLAGFITPACAKWNLENQIAAESADTIDWSALDQVTVRAIQIYDDPAAAAAALADRIHHVPTFAAHRLSPLFNGDGSPVFLVNERNRDLIERALRLFAALKAPKVDGVADKGAAGEDAVVIDPGNVAMPYTRGPKPERPTPWPRENTAWDHEPIFVVASLFEHNRLDIQLQAMGWKTSGASIVIVNALSGIDALHRLDETRPIYVDPMWWMDSSINDLVKGTLRTYLADTHHRRQFADQSAGEDRPAPAPAPAPRDDRHGNHAMLAKMDPKEPFFILRGQDVFASGLVKQWADLAESGGVRRDKIENARQCARAMRQWPVKKLPD